MTPSPTAAPTLTPTPEPEPTSTPQPRLTANERRRLYELALSGAILEATRRYEEAGAAFSQARDLKPDSAYLDVLAGEALLNSGDSDGAIAAARRAIDEHGGDAASFRLLAKAYSAKRQWSDAAEAYERVLEYEPNDVEALSQLSRIYQAASRPEDALEMFKRLIEADPARDLQYRYNAAMVYSQLQQFENALAEFERIAEALPDNYDVHVRIGDLNSLLNRPDEAVKSYLTALDHVSGASEELRVRRLLGLLYSQRGSWREARFQYSRILELEPGDVNAHRGAAAAAIQLDEPEQAIDHVEAAVKAKPDDYSLRAWQYEVLSAVDREREGLQALLDGLAAAIGDNDKTAPFASSLFFGETLERFEENGMLAQLAQAAADAIDAHPDMPVLFFAQANTALAGGQDELARTRLEQAIERAGRAVAAEEPLEVNAWALQFQLRYRLRFALQRMGLSSDLLKTAINASLSMAELPMTHRLLGMVHADRNEWPEAVKAFQQALARLDETSPLRRQILFQLANAYEKQDRLDEVEEIMRDLIARNPGDAEAYNFLGYTFADRRVNLEESLSLIEKAHQLEPDDGNIIDSLGWVYFRMGKTSEAIDHLKRAATIEAGHPIILDHLGDAYAEQGRTDEALDAWRQALQAGPDHPYEFTPEFERTLREKIRRMETTPAP